MSRILKIRVDWRLFAVKNNNTFSFSPGLITLRFFIHRH